jgi:hypothetical protein
LTDIKKSQNWEKLHSIHTSVLTLKSHLFPSFSQTPTNLFSQFLSLHFAYQISQKMKGLDPTLKLAQIEANRLFSEHKAELEDAVRKKVESEVKEDRKVFFESKSFSNCRGEIDEENSGGE